MWGENVRESCSEKSSYNSFFYNSASLAKYFPHVMSSPSHEEKVAGSYS